MNEQKNLITDYDGMPTNSKRPSLTSYYSPARRRRFTAVTSDADRYVRKIGNLDDEGKYKYNASVMI